MKSLDTPLIDTSNPQINECETLVFLNRLLEKDKSKIYTFEFYHNNTETYNQIFTFDSEIFEVNNKIS